MASVSNETKVAICRAQQTVLQAAAIIDILEFYTDSPETTETNLALRGVGVLLNDARRDLSGLIA